MTAWPSSVVFGLMMISSSMPSVSIIRFNAVNRHEIARQYRTITDHTFEVDPQVVCVEDLEFADCNRDQCQSREIYKVNALDLNSSACSEGT